jgi:hypothetical protein
VSVTPSCFGGLQASDVAALPEALADAPGDGATAEGAEADPVAAPPPVQPATTAMITINAGIAVQ